MGWGGVGWGGGGGKLHLFCNAKNLVQLFYLFAF